MSADFYVKQDDTAPPITGVLVDEAGSAVDLAGATLAFTLAPLDGGAPTLDAVVASNDQDAGGARGAWSYAWKAADTATPGYFRAEVTVTFNDGTVETFPNDGYVVVRITPNLG